jgi:Plasmid pRiA4b ORF-3-like protein
MDLNLAQLHEVLQATFGWTDSHLHQFDIGGLTYGAPKFDQDGWSDRQTFEANSVRLADFTITDDSPITIVYEYDFGDSWTHVIELMAAPRQAGVKYSRCITGSRAGPPEDVGGTYGYADFLQAWSDPLHEEHRDMRRWVGRKFDPERFDLTENNKAIARAIRRSNGSYRFRHEN